MNEFDKENVIFTRKMYVFLGDGEGRPTNHIPRFNNEKLIVKMFNGKLLNTYSTSPTPSHHFIRYIENSSSSL